MALFQLRLVVEGIDLRRTTTHEQKDHPLGARREMRSPGEEGIVGVRCCRRTRTLLTEQAGKLSLTSRAFRNDQLSLFYKELFESYGFKTYFKQEGFHLDVTKKMDERFMRIAERAS